MSTKWASLILFGVLFASLAAVFLALPRWQARKTAARPDEGVTPVATATADQSIVVDVAPAATPIPQPSPVIAIDTPTPTYRPPTPTRGPSSDETAYARAMSEGLEALEQGRWNDAAAALTRASKIKPNTPEVADGLARATAGKRRDTLAAGLRMAASLEEKEQWHEAEKTYAEVLALDPSVSLAVIGHERAAARAEMEDKLLFHANNPARLASPAVLEEAADLLDQARAVDPSGPRLDAQIARLARVIEIASTPIRVVIESDNLTDVVIYQVGPQGTFLRREVDLRPGRYTVVGSRDGYRDVRMQLEVAPEKPPKPIMITCREAL